MSAVRGAIGPGDVVFPRIPGASAVAFGFAVAGVVGAAELELVAGGAVFALALAESATIGGVGDKLGGGIMG